MLKKISDLWFASFLVHKGFSLSDYEVIKKGKGKYHFNIDDENYKSMKIEFNDSIVSEIKMSMEKLKDLCF